MNSSLSTSTLLLHSPIALASLASDTIVALSTPYGRGGIGVIRISGVHACDFTRVLLRDNYYSPEPNRVALKPLYFLDRVEAADQALVTYFRSPRSFTGEDVVELSCHGSPILLQQVIDALLQLGARAADPGEFTLRALANKRLNLSQAEAIRDLIDAQTNAALRQAARQLNGELSSQLQPIKDSLISIVVSLESSLEFVEDDLPQANAKQITIRLSNLVNHIDNLTATFRTGQLLKSGLRVTFGGRPNVGKSSIFNGLLAYDRAITSDSPGTTRDSLSEAVDFNGIPVVLTDTAGLRDSADDVERLGVERTRRAVADADLVIVVLDGSQLEYVEDKQVLNAVGDVPCIVALNKSDLASFNDQKARELVDKLPIIAVSAKTGAGLDALRAAIIKPFIECSGDTISGFLITNARHFDLLQRSNAALRCSIDLLGQCVSEEILLVGLYDALRFLGEITGETTPDDVLSQIFSTFCIGK